MEARAKKNMSLGGQVSRPSGSTEEGLTILSNLPAVNTRKELAAAVGIGEVTMGKVMQIDEHAPAAIREALDSKEVSVSGAWKMLKVVRQFPLEEQETAADEMVAAVREVHRIDAEAEKRGKIAGIFCKAYEKAVLLTPTLENVRFWIEGTRMRADEIEGTMKESYELARTFQTIGDILQKEILPLY